MPNLGSSPHDKNFVAGLIVQSSTGTRTDPMVELYADPTTHRLLVDSNITIDSVTLNDAASAETSTVYSGATALTPLFATISASSNGDNTIIAAVSSKRIRVLNGLLMAAGTVNVYFRDDPAGTAITGTLYPLANGGFQIPYSPIGNFQTSAGKALVLNLSSGVAVGGWLTYITV